MNWGINDLQILTEGWQKRKLRGKSIRIAVLDSGIQTDHPELTEAFGVAPAFHFSPPNQPPMLDVQGHGTCTAGLVAARGNSLAFGVAPQCTLLVGKIDFTPASLRLAVDWCCNPKLRVNIILMPLELPDRPDWQADLAALRTSLDRAIQLGITPVAAVGNSGLPTNRVFFPASFGNCIAVGAVQQGLLPHPGSARTTTIDVAAPGHSLLTTAIGSTIKRDFQDTSAAAAFTAGVLALAMQYAKIKRKKPSPADWKQAIRETATFLPAYASDGPACNNSKVGCGVINPLGLFQKIES
jgi:subtilisin family serine protease